MLITAIIILAVATAVVELLIVYNVPFLKNLCGKWLWFGVAMSLLLSIFVGFFFGAVGLVALTGGLLSTVITQPVYFIDHMVTLMKQKKAARGLVLA